jgi:hypothetical protein
VNRIHRRIATAAAFLTLACTLCAADGVDASSLIGMGPREALAALGAPQEIFSLRGPQEEADDVVFFYPDCSYLFWHASRVWQVRFDRRFTGTVLGLTLGMSRERVSERMGAASGERGSALFYDLTGAAYPVRARLVFAGGALTDVYVYRSDL